jgi:hypothetical protein
MNRISRKKVDPDQEYVLLGAMIMNKDVMESSYNRYKKGELKSRHFSKYFQPVFKWLIQYYTRNKDCPGITIKKIFDNRKKSMDEETQELVEDYLERLGKEYAESESEANYIRSEVIPDFIREREISNLIDKIQNNIDKKDFETAESIFASYSAVTEGEEQEDENLGVIMPLTIEDVKEGMKPGNIEKVAYRFPGALGDMLGPWCKGWLVAVTGIEKSGKSFLLNEIGYDAALNQKQKVLYINIELSEALARQRNYRRISRTATKQVVGPKGKRLIFPVFDCENNQHHTCKIMKKMKNKTPLFRSIDEVVSYQQRKDWITCDKCRDSPIRRNAARNKRFIPSVWFERSKKRIRMTTEKRIINAIKKHDMLKYSNFRIKCFPRFSVTFDDCEDYIRKYIEKTGWHPDIIIFDYLDIMLPEKGAKETRIDIDMKWKKASRLAGQLNCLVINADQATKAGRTQYQLDQMSTSESKTKDSHLDIRIAVNSTDEEKALGIARIGCLFHRHEQFNVKSEVIITQRLATSQPILDCYSIYGRKTYRIKINET